MNPTQAVAGSPCPRGNWHQYQVSVCTLTPSFTRKEKETSWLLSPPASTLAMEKVSTDFPSFFFPIPFVWHEEPWQISFILSFFILGGAFEAQTGARGNEL